MKDETKIFEHVKILKPKTMKENNIEPKLIDGAQFLIFHKKPFCNLKSFVDTQGKVLATTNHKESIDVALKAISMMFNTDPINLWVDIEHLANLGETIKEKREKNNE